MIYLASQSPQRKKLLRQARIPFTVIRSAHKERFFRRFSARANALWNAVQKARKASVRRGVVLGADTLVACRGHMLGKPKSRLDAYRILALCSGRKQVVYTAVCLRDAATGRETVFCVASDVWFRKLSHADIEAYLDSGEYRDKAGAYAIQGDGKGFVQKLRGSRSNVIGLPLEELKIRLQAFRRG